MPYRNKSLLQIARDQSCVACGAAETVVSAHANLQEFGKGLGIKASDAAVMHLCQSCHSELDQGQRMTKAERRAYQFEMIARTLVRLIEQGQLVVAK